jgi:hypothetical protein
VTSEEEDNGERVFLDMCLRKSAAKVVVKFFGCYWPKHLLPTTSFQTRRNWIA